MRKAIGIPGLIVGLYLGVGAYFGWALCTAMPAVNWMGGAYVALTWPTWLKVSPIKLPIPSWMFSFEEPSDDR